jgi:hypothetical protein
MVRIVLIVLSSYRLPVAGSVAGVTVGANGVTVASRPRVAVGEGIGVATGSVAGSVVGSVAGSAVLVARGTLTGGVGSSEGVGTGNASSPVTPRRTRAATRSKARTMVTARAPSMLAWLVSCFISIASSFVVVRVVHYRRTKKGALAAGGESRSEGRD